MAEELKACPFCGGKAETVQFTKKRWTVECFADGCGAGIISQGDMQTAIAAWNNRAQLPSQGGEEVAVAYIPVDRETGEHWHPVKYKGTGHICDYIPLYTHPADQVEDDLTMVKVSRELLEELRDAANEARNEAERPYRISFFSALVGKADALLNGGRS